MNKKYVPIETIKYELSKIRKSSNFSYKQAIERNRKNQVKHPPLIDLLNFLKHSNTPKPEIDRIVGEYWSEVEKNKNFEKDIVKQIKIKYSKYR